MKPRTICTLLLCLAYLSLFPASAHAWSQKMLISASVHKHEFDEIAIASQGCSLELTLRFDAPEAAYTAKNAARNYYRFRARVEFTDHVVKTGTFSNDRPGRRSIRQVHDTTGEGCWAKQAQKLRGVHLEGCRNRGCRVPALE